MRHKSRRLNIENKGERRKIQKKIDKYIKEHPQEQLLTNRSIKKHVKRMSTVEILKRTLKEKTKRDKSFIIKMDVRKKRKADRFKSNKGGN